jgi:hypothetical protein
MTQFFLPSSRHALFFVFLALFTAIAVLPAKQPAANETPPPRLEDFFGYYEGRSLFPMGEAHNRQLSVRIQSFDETGFTVDWSTIIHRKDGSDQKTQSFSFVSSLDPGVYVTKPALPTTTIVGAPIAWAALKGATLTVNVLTVVDTGDYVAQSYARTLEPGGLALDFTRVRSGTIERTIKGTLKRVDETPPAKEDGQTH